MGGTVQRLEALLIGLTLVIAAAAVAVTLLLHPVSPAGPATLRPLTQVTEVEPTAVPAPTPTDISIRTAERVWDANRLTALRSFAWPWLLLISLMTGGGLLVARSRRRRLPYTNQSMGQFLAAADQTTRATTVRVLRDLAGRGMLSGELAQVARAGRMRPSISLRVYRSQLTLPKLSLPALRVPRLLLPRLERFWQLVPLTLPRLRWPRLIRKPSAPAAPAAAELVVAPARWTVEDRALGVAIALMELWEGESACPILAIDIASKPGSSVLLTLDPHASDAQIADLPARLVELRPQWRARWRRERLEVVVEPGQLPSGGPALLPILMHGARGKVSRFLPLATCQHIGLYGVGAHQALHALLGSLLFAQSPADLALAMLDQGQAAPLYRQVAHLVPAPVNDALATLTSALRQRESLGLRPLLLVVVEPDEAQLRAVQTLITRLRATPGAPLHIVLVQEQPRSAGRELYALLPALITHGQGRADLLPGGTWPKRGAARLVGRGLRLDGRAPSVDDTALAAMLAQLCGPQAGLPPCLLDLPAPGEGAQINQDGAMTDTPIPSEPNSRLSTLLRAARAAGCVDAPTVAVPVIAQIRQVAEPLAEEADNGRPAGSAPLGRVALAELLARVVAAPAITSGLPNERGLTKNRLAEQIQLPAAQAKAQAETLLAWFDLAGLLVEPTQPERLRHPRALKTTDLAALAALLHATACPDAATVQALWARHPEGND